MTIFHVPLLANNHCVMNEEESMHATKVLRLKTGDAIMVTDGLGQMWEATIDVAHHKHCSFRLVKQMQTHNLPYRLHIGIAPTKNIDRFEWFVEKATEIGVSHITPIICKHSERKIIKDDRIQKIIVSACKQSVKATFPLLGAACTFEQFVERNEASQKFIAHCYALDKKELKHELQALSDAIVLIGPEGDFSASEIALALQKQYIAVALGASRLRTETAGVYAAAAASMVNL